MRIAARIIQIALIVIALLFLSSYFFSPIGMTVEAEAKGKLVLVAVGAVLLIIAISMSLLLHRTKAPDGEDNWTMPYRVCTDSQYTLYEYKTLYIYILYSLLALILLGYALNYAAIGIAGVVGMVLYFVIVSTQQIGVSRAIRRAANSGSVEISGNKWSFKSPLRVKVPKDIPSGN